MYVRLESATSGYVGKKNWLFIGEAGAGQRRAILYTLVESCRRRNIVSV